MTSDPTDCGDCEEDITCGRCGERFHPTRTFDEATRETALLFGEDPKNRYDPGFVEVCEDCWWDMAEQELDSLS